jgi:predicted peptidase
MKKRITSIFCSFLLLPAFAIAQHHGSFEKNWFIEGTDTLPYRLLLPVNYDSQKEYPLILFLHGAGERGNNSRMYVGGLSLGGMGTYDLVYRMPKTFAAAFPICGAYNAASARKMKNTTWWIFHGQRDSTVSVEYGKEMAAVLRKSGAKVKLTIYPDASHNSWDQAFQEPGLFAWMFSKSIKQRHVKN